jgi:hypothetical protein
MKIAFSCCAIAALLSAPGQATTAKVGERQRGKRGLRRSSSSLDECPSEGALHQAPSFGELEDELRQGVLNGCLNTWHENYAKGAFAFSHSLAAWVRRVLGASEEQFPLKFAYHIHKGETVEDCYDVEIPQSFAKGGGASLCDFIESLSSLDYSTLLQFMIELLDYGQYTLNAKGDVSSIDRYRYGSPVQNSSSHTNVWYPDVLELASGLGFNQFMEQYGFLEGNTDYYAHELYGYVEGGGGDGAGFEIYCVDMETNHETTILSGGGGGSETYIPSVCVVAYIALILMPTC